MNESVTPTPGPLHGYRVIDVTVMVAGPLAAMLLGDQGAENIRLVEDELFGSDAKRTSASGPRSQSAPS